MAAAPPQFLSASAALRPKRGMSVIGASVSGSWTKLAIQPPRRRRCPLVAQMRSADRVRKCLLFGVERTCGRHHETDAFDPNADVAAPLARGSPARKVRAVRP